MNFCKRKLFELFLLSQSREHPELRSALELLSDVTATMSQLLWMFRTPPDFQEVLPDIPPNSDWTSTLLPASAVHQ